VHDPAASRITLSLAALIVISVGESRDRHTKGTDYKLRRGGTDRI